MVLNRSGSLAELPTSSYGHQIAEYFEEHSIKNLTDI